MSTVSDAAYQAPGLVYETEHHHDHFSPQKSYMGFWIFMMSDLIIFGLFFATYGTMLGKPSIAGGPGPKEAFELSGAAWETVALLLSTFTFGLASLAMKYDMGKQKILTWMGVTLFLGLCFLGLELREFVTMFHEGHVPQRSGFLSAFFGLVPLHGLHVTSGSIWLIIMMIRIATGPIDELTKSRVARLALFWHFLDLIWVGIFSIVYLGGLA
ncbi:cytochrome c oxidase subunit 3 [Acidimangrovimonas sediminis]|uniref:cytochrome c oxidase subunit 3 n=1 Tax=Acidimangrovimonas sediminis TaxID=2056283 RepID=UPI000C80D973|nr:cytochrome c oxidase subunit 3 [Acidimangrovimonas sediminis]